jgi:hypothetical protein
MAKQLRPILFVLLMAALVSMAYGLNYMYYSDHELTWFGDHTTFRHGDTLDGPIRCNWEISIMQDPVFRDFVISSEDDFWRGSQYAPQFAGGYGPVFNSPAMGLPRDAAWLRNFALEQGHFFSGGDTMQARVEVLTDRLKIWWSRLSMPFDTANFGEHYLPDSAMIFFDCGELHLFGTIGTKLIIGASGTILFEDNLVYASADARGIAPAGHPEKLAVVAEGNLKIQNTWANGRENSHGSGNLQTDMDSTSIVLDGIYMALNESFTFEQQNDPDSGYVCIPCGCNASGYGGGPDNRGYIYLFGSIMQARRGYVHRSTCTSTGYILTHRYDRDLKFWSLAGASVDDDFRFSDSLLDLGSVAVGQSAADTLRVFNFDVPVKFDSVRISPPFFSTTPPDSYMWRQAIPLSFAPSAEGTFVDTLRFYNSYYNHWFAVPIRGVATTSSGASDVGAPAPIRFDLQAYPNPFNPSTEIEFSVPNSGKVLLGVYDILGQRISVLKDGYLSAGAHRITFDGQRYPSGIYFVRAETASHQQTLKLVLMK